MGVSTRQEVIQSSFDEIMTDENSLKKEVKSADLQDLYLIFRNIKNASYPLSILSPTRELMSNIGIGY